MKTKSKKSHVVKVKILGFILTLMSLVSLVAINLIIAKDHGFIIRFIEYEMGLEYRLLAPTFAWLWGTLLTILVACWIVRIRTINWMCALEIERMETTVAIKITNRDNKIRELTQKLQNLEKEKQGLEKANHAACVLIRQALNIVTNPNKKYIYPIRKEGTA